jgi:hypothetical protein
MLSECGEREDGFNTNRHSQRGRWERGNEDVGNEGNLLNSVNLTKHIK